MATVTINLGNDLVERASEHAQAEGKSLDDLISALLAKELGSINEKPGIKPAEPGAAKAIRELFNLADQKGWRSSGPYPSREERNRR